MTPARKSGEAGKPATRAAKQPARSKAQPAQRRSGAQQYVALLRAINVGKHIVRMEQLRALFEELKFGDVATFIASGNVIFHAQSADEAALTDRIERHLRARLGYDVTTFLRTPAELAEIAAYDPFPATAGTGEVHALYVAFLKQPPSPDATNRVLAYTNDTDLLHVHGREVYWLARKTLTDSTFSGALLEKTVGPATLRNVSTVRRLVAKYPVASAP